MQKIPRHGPPKQHVLLQFTELSYTYDKILHYSIFYVTRGNGRRGNIINAKFRQRHNNFIQSSAYAFKSPLRHSEQANNERTIPTFFSAKHIWNHFTILD